MYPPCGDSVSLQPSNRDALWNRTGCQKHIRICLLSRASFLLGRAFAWKTGGKIYDFYGRQAEMRRNKAGAR